MNEMNLFFAVISSVVVLLLLCGITLYRTEMRYRTEVRRKQHEGPWQGLTQSIPVIAWSIDSNGLLQFLNVRWTQLTGRAVEDSLGRAWLAATHPDDCATLKAIWQQAQQFGEPFEVVHRLQSVTGHYRWQRSRGQPQQDETGTIMGWHGITDDIHEFYLSEQALRESEERLRLGTSVARLAIAEIDYIHDILYTNEQIIALFGLPAGCGPTVSRAAMHALVHSDDRPTLLAQIEAALDPASARWFAMEYRVVRPDGTIRWLSVRKQNFFEENEQGQQCPVRALLAAQDITERRQAEEALIETAREKELALAQLDAIFSAAPIGLGFWDTDLRFLRLNQTLADINGLPIDAQIGRHVADVVPQINDVEDMLSTWQQVIETGEPLLNVEVTGMTRATSNQQRYWLDNFFPVRIGEELIGIGATVLDITERKLYEEEIIQLNNQLEERVEERTAQVLAVNQELEAFAYSVSHDLRSPLRAIDGYTRILLEDYISQLDAEAIRICGVVCNEAQRMGQLIDDLLAFSRLGRATLQKVQVDMVQLVQTVYEELRGSQGAQDPVFTLHPLPPALGDPTMMRQVWQNLLDNALKFSQKQPSVQIVVNFVATERETIYSICDNGAGFDMRYVGKLFGVFQRLHSTHEFPGTGVGLAIVQRIIHRHGGRVWAESAVDAGATFYIALPKPHK